MISYLKSPALGITRRLRTIQDIKHPEGLDQVFNRIISLISMAPRPEQDLA